MADASMNLLETLRKVGADGDVDLLREGVRVLGAQAETLDLDYLDRWIREFELDDAWERARRLAG